MVKVVDDIFQNKKFVPNFIHVLPLEHKFTNIRTSLCYVPF